MPAILTEYLLIKSISYLIETVQLTYIDRKEYVLTAIFCQFIDGNLNRFREKVFLFVRNLQFRQPACRQVLKPESCLFMKFWIPDQVRHDRKGIFINRHYQINLTLIGILLYKID
jgi:hypothetical protein